MNVLLVHAIAEHVGLSAAEFECCQLIQDEGPFTAGELAKRCHITSGGMTGMIDRLERAGFVQRSVDPKDRRRVLVAAVLKGSKVQSAVRTVRVMYGPMQQQFNDILAQFTDDQITFLVDFMIKTNDMFRETIAALPEK